MGTAVVAFIDVGQGDSTVAIDLEAGAGILIDCPSAGPAAVLTLFEQYELVRLDLAVLTHGDLDHAGGMVTVLSAFPPRAIRYNHDTIMPSDPEESLKLLAVLRGFLRLEQKYEVRLEGATYGASGNLGVVRWTIPSPTHGLITRAQSSRARNTGSVVIRLDVDGRRFLVAGDADGYVWKRLLDQLHDEVPADVFLVPHHGAALAADGGRPDIIAVLAAVRAKHHIISAGAVNRYGHPSLATLAAVRSFGGRLTCTEAGVHCAAGGSRPIAEARVLTARFLTGKPLTESNCPCAGTVTFALQDGVWIDRPSAEEHGVVINALASPQCRDIGAVL
jgi:competence protein ComEC